MRSYINRYSLNNKNMKIIKIGRTSNNDVIINDDSKISRNHCQIILDDYGKFRVVDLGSTNGTYVNGVKRHGEIPLNPEDIIRIGNTTLPWQSYFKNEGLGGVANKPDNYMIWAILATILCSLPFGIVSIVYASKVDGLWISGQRIAANDAASKARLWLLVSVGIGVVSNIIGAILLFTF